MASKQSEVASVADGQRFISHHLAVSLEFLQRLDATTSLSALGKAASELSMSTAFSGIGCPEQVHYMGCRALAKILETEYATLRHLWSLEFDAECNYELAMSPARPMCRFGDIAEGIDVKVRDRLLLAAESIPYDELSATFKAANVMTARMHCLSHGKACALKRACLHVAGTECIHFSKAGPRPGTQCKRMVYFLCWVHQRRRVQEDFILHENVEAFPLRVLEEQLGDYYIIPRGGSMVFCASACGNACKRPRRWTWLVHKKSLIFEPVRELLLPWDEFVKMFYRTATYSWREYFCADDGHVREELNWARTSKRQGVGGDDTFFAMLTKAEQQQLSIYEEMCNEGVCAIGQDPTQRPVHNMGRMELPCITKHMNFILGF